MRLSRLPLSTLLDSASGHLEAHLLQKKESAPPGIEGSAPYSGIIFSGNPHETVPRRLLLDDRLTPLERNTWQVFRLLINDDGLTAFPTYDQLRPYLGMQPGRPASRETVSKALVTLRLTRWLSLGRRVRNDLSGQIQGNVYLLHDEPVTPAEAIEFDKDYLQLLAQSMVHQTKVIREVAEIAWKEFASDPDVGQRLPSRLDIIENRLNSQAWTKAQAQGAVKAPEFGIRTPQNLAQSALSSDTELSENGGGQFTLEPSSDPELSRKSLGSDLVRNPNSYSTYTDTHKAVCKSSVHVPLTSTDMAADLLDALHRLPVDQKQNAVMALQKVPTELKPALIKQWVHRCDAGGIRNPLGYLMTLVGMAVRGDFNSQWDPEGKARSSPGCQGAVEPPPNAIQPAKTAALPRSPESVQTARNTLSGMLHLLKPNRGSHP
ncbi:MULTISPECIES: STY4528 family pathogenicity island replication protein [unclassified Pseudomonas]|uniref:STY4528 family pathogenicity island replication protein n=1 Tax=unclassified Pseudomonas TaxID=196821 RepID=UPI00160B1B25|nr:MULTISPECIES: STY4528 family pathogenicity island replication protein [unclassified Pseudomonas]